MDTIGRNEKEASGWSKRAQQIDRMEYLATKQEKHFTLYFPHHFPRTNHTLKLHINKYLYSLSKHINHRTNIPAKIQAY